MKHILIKILYSIPAFLFTGFVIWFFTGIRQPAGPVAAGTEAENAAPEDERTETALTKSYSISFSSPSGFYNSPFSLTLTGPEDFNIYYTLDGSLPDSSSLLYTEPVSVTDVSGTEKLYSSRSDFSVNGTAVEAERMEKAFIIRAVGIDKNGVSTEIASATYFIGFDDIYQNKSVVSVITDPANLFDAQTGIYVLGNSYHAAAANGATPEAEQLANYMQRGKLWERPVHIDFFDKNKEYVFSQEAGIRINGNSSRGDSRKSLRFYARKEYDGNSRFVSPLIPETKNPNSIILRRGEFANQFLPSLVYDRNFATQKYAPCVVFIDGEYWGEYYLLERFDTTHMQNYYDVDKDNVTILKDGALSSGSVKVENEYKDLLDFISSNDLSVEENYDYVCSKLDMQSYIDYYCSQIYLNNFDFCEVKNIVLWRSNEADPVNPYADTRWRFGLMDLDFTLTRFGGEENYTTNTFYDQSGHAVAFQKEETMMRAFLENETFRRQFATTFMDLENVNFDYGTVSEKIDAVAEYVETPDVWKEFFEKRPEYINRYLAETFSLNGTLTEVTLESTDPAAGRIRLNTVTPDLSAGTWSGIYYSDYPVTVTALSMEGYRFAGWEVNGKAISADETAEIPLDDGDVHITACFEKNEE